jgi:hypothetical protein
VVDITKFYWEAKTRANYQKYQRRFADGWAPCEREPRGESRGNYELLGSNGQF